MTREGGVPESAPGDGGRAIRFLIEGLVIVASILLAFVIDAAWDVRQERVEEAEILAGLEREFTDYRDALVRSAAQQEDMLAAMTAILAATEEGAWRSTEWEPDAAIGRLFSPPTSDLGNGVRDALVQAGRLELITDPVLRERLASWPGYYEEVLDDEVFSRDLVSDQIIPYFVRSGLEISRVLVFGAVSTRAAPEEVWPVAVGRITDDSEAFRRLLSDPEFEALVGVRYVYWRHAGGEYRRALEAAEEILGLLEQSRGLRS